MPNANAVLGHNGSVVAQSINTEPGCLLERIPEGESVLNISYVGVRLGRWHWT